MFIISMSDHNNPSKIRFPFIDWLRGFAIFLMVIYHFCYDLDMFGYIDTAFGHGYWVPFRYIIVIGFLSLVGVSLVIVHGKSIRWSSLKKRTFQLALASLAVSISSYFIAPQKVTIFGILQFILVASWFVLPLLKRPQVSFVLGVSIFTLGHVIQSRVFESNWIHWLGMVVEKRPALDYVPIFPWLGVVLIGISLAHFFLYTSIGQKIASLDLTRLTGVGKFNLMLEKMGQHSLVIYLVHQPIMFAGFYFIELLK